MGEAGFLEGPFREEARSGLEVTVALDDFLAASSACSFSKSKTVLASGLNGIRLLLIFTGTGLCVHFPGGARLDGSTNL